MATKRTQYGHITTEQVVELIKEGLSQSEAANSLQVPRGVVESHCQRAIYKGLLPMNSDPSRQHHPPPPPDTRSITGYLMGDPLPGRSALDQDNK
jgi:hypothetical protein